MPPAPTSPPLDDPAACAAALRAVGFDAADYRAANPDLVALTLDEVTFHYHQEGRSERRAVRFGLPFAQALARLEALDLSAEARQLLRQDLAVAVVRQADFWGREPGPVADLLAPSPAYRPLVIIGDSHGMLYVQEDVLRVGGLAPIPALATGASARGLGNPQSRGKAREKIRAFLEAWGPRMSEAVLLLKFGQVDLEFVHDFRRLRDGAAAFDLQEAAAFARESARRYVAFAAELQSLTPARLVVSSALPPALNDTALRQGYVNAHIVQLHGELAADEIEQGLRGLEMPDWATRTELARVYNLAAAEGCAATGLTHFDDFSPLLGADGVVRPELIVWHGGTDHHLCFTSPAGRQAAGALALALSGL